MITTAQICGISIYDSDGTLSFEVNHTVSGEVTIKHYGKDALGMDVDEAKAIVRALTCLLAEPDMKE